MGTANSIMEELAEKVEKTPGWTVRRGKRNLICTSPKDECVTIARHAGDSRTYRNAVSRLKTKGWVEDVEAGEQAAEDKRAAGNAAHDREVERAAARAAAQKAEFEAAQAAAPAKVAPVKAVKRAPSKKAAATAARVAATAARVAAAAPMSPALAAAGPVEAKARRVVEEGRPTPDELSAPLPPVVTLRDLVAPVLPPAAGNGSAPPAAAPVPAAKPNGLVVVTAPFVLPTPPAAYDPADLFTVTEVLTYEKALEWRDRPPAKLKDGRDLIQRPRSPKNVRKLADIMRLDEWSHHHQGFAVAPDGGILDGQHRIAAVIEVATQAADVATRHGVIHFEPMPDIALKVQVTYNVDADTFVDMDHGVNRTMGHTLKILGNTDSNNLASAGKLWWCVQNFLTAPNGPYGTPANWNRMSPSDRQLKDLLEDPTTNIADHVHAGYKMAKKINGIPAPGIVFRALAYARWPAGIDRLNDFCDEVRVGNMLEEGNPAKTLREWMLSGTGKHTDAKRERQFIGYIRAWNKWVPGESMGQMAVNPLNPMPLPISPKPKK